MPIPVFIDEVLRRRLADRAKPLRAPRPHPDEISRLYGIPGIPQPVDATALDHQQPVLDDVQESLRTRRSQFAIGLKLDAVLSEPGAERRSNVHDGGSILHSRKCRAHKSVRSKQQMMGLMRAARLTRIIHVASLSEILATTPIVRANALRTPQRWPRLGDALIRRDHG